MLLELELKPWARFDKLRLAAEPMELRALRMPMSGWGCVLPAAGWLRLLVLPLPLLGTVRREPPPGKLSPSRSRAWALNSSS